MLVKSMRFVGATSTVIEVRLVGEIIQGMFIPGNINMPPFVVVVDLLRRMK